jgi:hypothetical protein
MNTHDDQKEDIRGVENDWLRWDWGLPGYLVMEIENQKSATQISFKCSLKCWAGISEKKMRTGEGYFKSCGGCGRRPSLSRILAIASHWIE